VGCRGEESNLADALRVVGHTQGGAPNSSRREQEDEASETLAGKRRKKKPKKIHMAGKSRDQEEVAYLRAPLAAS